MKYIILSGLLILTILEGEETMKNTLSILQLFSMCMVPISKPVL